MPNWVYNYLDVKGPESDVAAIKEQLGRPFTLAQENHGMGDITPHGFPTKIKEVTYSNPVFAFFNIVNYRDHGITDEEYAKQPMRSELDIKDPNWWADNMRLEAIDKSWYSWNNHNWGTKWDVAVADDEKYPETECYYDGKDQLGYKFNTPWGIPEKALITLASQHPTCEFTLEYQEETGWGGHIVWRDGVEVESHQYDYKCPECEYDEEGDLEDIWCDDCGTQVCPSCGFNEEGCDHIERKAIVQTR